MNLLETITKRASVWAPVALFLSAPAWASALQPVLQDPATPPATPPPVVKEVPKPKPDTSKDEELAKKKRILEEEAKRKEELLRRKQEGVQGKRFPGDDKPTVKPIPVKQGGDPTRGINPKLDVTSSADKAELARREQEQLMQSDPGAKLVIEFGSERFDLGRLMQGDKVQHTFTMQAGGTTPLKIRQVKPSCGCTVGSVDVADAEGNFSPYNYGDPIEPGRSVRVNASMDTTNKKNKVQVRIQVMSNDPAGVHALTLAAEVQPFLVVSPQMINFGDIPLGGQRSQTVDIRTSKGEPVQMDVDRTRIAAMPAGMTYELLPVNPDAAGKSGHWQLKVNVNSEALEGPMNAAFRLVTDVEMPVDPAKETAAVERGSHIVPQFFSTNVSCAGKILGSFSLDREYLSFGLFRPGQVVPRSVRLTCNEEAMALDKVQVHLQGRDGVPFELTDLFEISVKPVAGVKAVDIELRMKGFPDGTDQSFNGELVIDPGYPDCPTKNVKFTGICRSGVEQR